MVSVLLKAGAAVMTKLLMAMASEAVIEWFLFYVAEQIVRNTKTQHDDEFYTKIRKAYYEGK